VGRGCRLFREQPGVAADIPDHLDLVAEKERTGRERG
jgi:hypothetical protein